MNQYQWLSCQDCCCVVALIVIRSSIAMLWHVPFHFHGKAYNTAATPAATAPTLHWHPSPHRSPCTQYFLNNLRHVPHQHCNIILISLTAKTGCCYLLQCCCISLVGCSICYRVKTAMLQLLLHVPLLCPFIAFDLQAWYNPWYCLAWWLFCWQSSHVQFSRE